MYITLELDPANQGKIGFFGYDVSTSAFTVIPDATNTSDTFSGSVGNAIFNQVTGILQTAAQTNVTSVGALSGGSIANGFGTISTGNTITTTAAMTAGSLQVNGAGVLTGTLTAATNPSIGNLTLANGSITDSSGAISFGDENLSTTGTLASGALSVTGTGAFSSTISAATGSTVGTLTLANGSITDSSGAISFGDENLTTSGTLASGALSVTGTGTFSSTISAATGSTVGNLTLANGSITDSSGAISFDNENLYNRNTCFRCPFSNRNRFFLFNYKCCYWIYNRQYDTR